MFSRTSKHKEKKAHQEEESTMTTVRRTLFLSSVVQNNSCCLEDSLCLIENLNIPSHLGYFEFWRFPQLGRVVEEVSYNRWQHKNNKQELNWNRIILRAMNNINQIDYVNSTKLSNQNIQVHDLGAPSCLALQ